MTCNAADSQIIYAVQTPDGAILRVISAAASHGTRHYGWPIPVKVLDVNRIDTDCCYIVRVIHIRHE